MENKKINGMTIEDALEKYENMVYKVVNTAKTNAVCSCDDMVQEGYIAIVEAFNNYNPDKGASFSTWVYRYITGAILDYQKAHLSALSGGHYLQSILKKAGPDATQEDLLAMGLRKNTAHAALYINENFSTANYDALEGVVDYSSNDQMENNLSLGFFNWKKYLTKREIEVIDYNFGFYGGEPLPKTEIARRLGISRDRVGEIYSNAIRKLKRCEEINDYMG